MEEKQPLTEYQVKVREIDELHEDLLKLLGNGKSIPHDSPQLPLWLYLKEVWGIEKRELEALDPTSHATLDKCAAFNILLGYLNPEAELVLDLEGEKSIENFLRKKISEYTK